MTEMSKDVLRFFLQCDPRARRYFAVEVHPDRESMRREIVRLGGKRRDTRNTRAVCLRIKLKDPDEKHEAIGIILFVRDDMGPEVVVHELTHAALGWAREVGVKPISPFSRRQSQASDQEEQFVCQLQSLFEQFYQRLREASAPKALAAA